MFLKPAWIDRWGQEIEHSSGQTAEEQLAVRIETRLFIPNLNKSSEQIGVHMSNIITLDQ